MSKVTKIKGDLDDVGALIEIMSVIKDVATNRYFTYAQRKADFQKLFESFMDFFRLSAQGLSTDCPLLANQNKGVDIVVVASDQSFMAQLNGRVSTAALAECQKYPDANIICVGRRVADKFKGAGLGKNIIQIFTQQEIPDRYELAMALRECLVKRMMDGLTGKTIITHLFTKSFSVVKPNILTVLPTAELAKKSEGEVSPAAAQVAKANLIVESPGDKIIKALADIWVHSRLYEILSELLLVETAVQAQQLESALESLSGEKKGLVIGYRKAGREKINKSMREVFAQISVGKHK